MDTNQIKVPSINKNLRLCIIENTIAIEELISKSIGNILDIEHGTSKSFGFSSSALSFNQKVQIIQDIKDVDKELINKFTCLTNIRNKFAHVSSIDSFDNLFASSKNGKVIQKLLKKWYENQIDNEHPEFYLICFYLLIQELIEFIFMLSKNHMYNKGYEVGRNEGQKLFSDLLSKEVKKLSNHEEIFETVFAEMDRIKKLEK